MGITNPQESQKFSLEIPSGLRYLLVLDSFLENVFLRSLSEAANQQFGASLVLAVHELGTNIMTHAYPEDNQGQIHFEVQIAQHPTAITIETFDSGIPLPEEKNIPRQLTTELQIHGYGLFLIRQIMDEVHYTRSANGNRWILTKEIEEVS